MIGFIKKVMAAQKDSVTQQTVVISGMIQVEIIIVGMIAMASVPVNVKATEQLAPPILTHVPKLTLPVSSTTIMAAVATPRKDDGRAMEKIESVLTNPTKGRLKGVSTIYLLSSINGQVPSYMYRYSGKNEIQFFRPTRESAPHHDVGEHSN
jgi:hypothetical protein